MSILNLLMPKKKIEAYFKSTVLPQLERFGPYTDTVSWFHAIDEDDKIRPLADRRAYLLKGKKFKPGKVYFTKYKKPTEDKGACFFIEDIGAVYSIDDYKILSNVYAYAKNEIDVLLFVWK